MTDAEIIKALSSMLYAGHSCGKCKYDNGKGVDRCGLKGCKIARNALDLINRQKAEIERLTINMNAFGLGMKREKERADTIRAEAINEFAERLKKTANSRMYRKDVVYIVEINNLVKEMVGDTK